MALVSSKKMLADAQKNGYAVGAFNIENMEMAIAVVAAAEETRSPLILQTTPSTVRYAGLALYHSIVSALAESAGVPIALHLDHGNSFELACGALEAGYTSVMIDGSQLSFEENVSLTQRVVAKASGYGVPVEAELGKVGGKEDDLVGDADTNTDPEKAMEFATRTRVDSLAVAIGTAHGFYVKSPVLDKERLQQIRKVVDIPLVLHGASGLSDGDVKECIEYGICKVNFATELRAAFTDGIKSVLAEKPSTFDPKPLGKAGMERVKNLVIGRMNVCGCIGRA